MFRSAMIASALLALTCAGCHSAPERTYSEAYEQKLYTEAYDKASLVAVDEHAKDRQRAALVAGMSAEAIGRNADAKRLLAPLRLSTDRDIAARATATLGLIAKKEGRHAEAAALLSSSGERLEGDGAANARILAGESYQRLGLDAQARSEYQQAKGEAESAELKAAAERKSTARPYVVQAGAYSTRTAAERAAKSIRPAVLKAGQPLPTIVEMAPNGTPLFAVQVGPYHDKATAMAAKAKMNLASAAVTTRQ